MGTEACQISIVHFNDVYNIQEREQEPVGGAARFMTAIKRLEHLDPIVLFGGDALNPSLLSTVTRGRQMVPILNALKVQCAVYGNHDFDYGVDNLVTLAKEMTFPWLLSNINDVLTGNPLAEGQITHMLECHGKKIGLVGLVEKDWIATISTLDKDDVVYTDYVREGRKLAQQLRHQGADYVIALTHMRWPNDTRLAEKVNEIDLVLGGHDHDFVIKQACGVVRRGCCWKGQVNGKYIIKSGTDFRNFSLITLTFENDGKVNVNVEERVVDSNIPEDEDIKTIVTKYTDIMGAKMETILGRFLVDCDGRFSSIRTRETNLGNFVTGIMMSAMNTDIALLNSGTLRSDSIHPKGDFKVKDLMAILPMSSSIIVLEVTGRDLLEVFENGVSQYPALEGRFLQMAGGSFIFDPNLTPKQRIDKDSVKVQGQPLDLDKKYRISTTAYVASGKDGYEVLKQCKVLVNEDDGPQLSSLVTNHFQSIMIVSGEKKPTYPHWQNIISKCRGEKLGVELAKDEKNTEKLRILQKMFESTSHKKRNRWQRAKETIVQNRLARIRLVEELEVCAALAPKVEGRIICQGDPTT